MQLSSNRKIATFPSIESAADIDVLHLMKEKFIASKGTEEQFAALALMLSSPHVINFPGTAKDIEEYLEGGHVLARDFKTEMLPIVKPVTEVKKEILEFSVLDIAQKIITSKYPDYGLTVGGEKRGTLSRLREEMRQSFSEFMQLDQEAQQKAQEEFKEEIQKDALTLQENKYPDVDPKLN